MFKNFLDEWHLLTSEIYITLERLCVTDMDNTLKKIRAYGNTPLLSLRFKHSSMMCDIFSKKANIHLRKISEDP